MAVIDLRDRGELGQVGAQIGQALGGLVGQLDPDNPLRKVLFRASDQERAERAIPQQERVQAIIEIHDRDRAQVQTDLKKLTDELDYLTELSTILPPAEQARNAARLQELQMTQAELEGMLTNREIDTLESLSRELPPEEAGEIQAMVERMRGVTAQAEGELAQEQIDVRAALRETGWGPREQAAIIAAQGRLEAQGIEITAERLNNMQRAMGDMTELERELFAVDPSFFAQHLLQEQRFTHDELMQQNAMLLQGARDPQEALKAQFLLKTQIRERNQALTDRMNEISEDRGRRDELPGLMEEMMDNAQTLLRVDPSAAAQTVRAVRGLANQLGLSDVPKAVEFSVTDITESRAEIVGLAAAQLREMGGASLENIEKLREGLKDPRTGFVNERLLLAIVEESEQGVEITDETREAAATEAIVTRGDGKASARRQQEIAELEESYANGLVGGMSMAELSAIRSELQHKKLVNWFQGVGERVQEGQRQQRESQPRFRPGP